MKSAWSTGEMKYWRVASKVIRTIQNVGAPIEASFHPQKRYVYVSTEKNVLAALSLKNGEIGENMIRSTTYSWRISAWRRVFDKPTGRIAHKGNGGSLPWSSLFFSFFRSDSDSGTSITQFRRWTVPLRQRRRFDRMECRLTIWWRKCRCPLCGRYGRRWSRRYRSSIWQTCSDEIRKRWTVDLVDKIEVGKILN